MQAGNRHTFRTTAVPQIGKFAGLWSSLPTIYEGEAVSAVDSTARESLASYLVHAPFSLARPRSDTHKH